ncbi:hypothetical protein ACIBF5_18170 [Micromonospora sp. NPDC050417]|uniref:hypothetical protein n=1 Tax=Micromonospora sp. NPDC050417 TaxID=3364280 RepID=UPI0037ABB30C
MAVSKSRIGWLLTIGATALTLGLQMRHTVKNTNRWPWCSYNMFSYRKSHRAMQLRTRLVTASGVCVGPTDPWGLLPLEFFRVISLLERIFFTQQDMAVREEFCRGVLARLNRAPWKGWDEVKPALLAPPGQRFAALELYLVAVDFDRCDPVDRLHVESVELVHRHDPDGVAATCPPPRWRLLDTAPAPAPATQTEGSTRP